MFFLFKTYALEVNHRFIYFNLVACVLFSTPTNLQIFSQIHEYKLKYFT